MTIEDVIAFNVTILLAIVNFPYTLKKIFEPSSKCYNMITNFNIPMVGYHLKQGRILMTVAEKKEWYLEYEITVNRAGLLGDISSLLGMLGISIVTINGVDQGRRGLLIKTDSLEKVNRFEHIINELSEIEITKLRVPELRDRLAVRHGRYIEQDADDKKLFVLNVKI